MTDYPKDYVGEWYIPGEVVPEQARKMIRHKKRELLDKLLDYASNRRYWVIWFDEEWTEAMYAPGSPVVRMNLVRPGDQIVRLRGRLSEVREERVVIPVMPEEPFMHYDVRYRRFSYDNYKFFILVAFLLLMFVGIVALLATV